MQGSGSRKPPAGGKSNSNPNSGGARPGTKAGGTPARPATMPAAQKSTSLPLEPQWVITDPNAQASLGQVPLQLQTTGQHQVFHLPPPGDHTGLLANSMGALTAGRFSPAIAAAGTAGAKNGLVGQASGAATGKAVANAGGDKAAAAKPKKEKRKKVTQACVYCRRSHMTCDIGRPCQRCIKRNIAHLCHDDHKQSSGDGGSVRSASPELKLSPTDHPMVSVTSALDTSNPMLGFSEPNHSPAVLPLVPGGHHLHDLGDGLVDPDHGLGHLDFHLGTVSGFPSLFAAEHSGHEFSILSDLLSTLDDGHLHDILGGQNHPILMGSHDVTNLLAGGSSVLAAHPHLSLQPPIPTSTPSSDGFARDKTEKFIFTAADPDDIVDASEDRLTRVIHAKFEAGLLKPYNYHNGYVRLQNYMENHVEPASRNRILSVISAIRPAFRAIGQSLTDLDLVLVEEQFERLLLEYDRVFTSVGVPACLWRRTGEIWKANREFANLVQLPMERLSQGRTCIYELMQEDSAVNYWEKYGNIAFDEGQKAVLTSCVLKNPDGNPMGHPGLLAGNATELFNSDFPNLENRRASISGAMPRKGSSSSVSSAVMPAPSGRKTVACCFSFTIRRDKYGMPILITGNFLPSQNDY